jgi:hypothetical protein
VTRKRPGVSKKRFLDATTKPPFLLPQFLGGLDQIKPVLFQIFGQRSFVLRKAQTGKRKRESTNGVQICLSITDAVATSLPTALLPLNFTVVCSGRGYESQYFLALQDS